MRIVLEVEAQQRRRVRLRHGEEVLGVRLRIVAGRERIGAPLQARGERQRAPVRILVVGHADALRRLVDDADPAGGGELGEVDGIEVRHVGDDGTDHADAPCRVGKGALAPCPRGLICLVEAKTWARA
jgi:hypothetical protein